VGFSLGEIILLILVGIIVVGPKRLPGMMRTAGQWVARIRRMSMDLRSQSGIDELLRQEGLDEHIRELRELRSLSRLNVVADLMAPRAAPLTMEAPTAPRLDQASATAEAPRARARRAWKAEEPLREREYPLIGCDAYGALPDDAAADPYAATPPEAIEQAPVTSPPTHPAPAPAGQS
jgi:sec-independent protein translocase protein TatB